VSVLGVAHRFNFASMRALAIRQLDSLTSCVDRIVLARQFGVDDWLRPAYTQVCMMRALISDEDIDRLGLELFKKVARARNRLSSTPCPKSEPAEKVVEAIFFPSAEAGAPPPLHCCDSRCARPFLRCWPCELPADPALPANLPAPVLPLQASPSPVGSHSSLSDTAASSIPASEDSLSRGRSPTPVRRFPSAE
jgi:hypothetical protein